MTAKCYEVDDNADPFPVSCWESTNGEAASCCVAEHGELCASNGVCVVDEKYVTAPYYTNGCTASG